MGAYFSYCDASGTENEPRPLVEAAIIAPEANWLRYERDWNGLLDRFNVPYLHMKELNTYPFRPPYDVWGDDTEIRKAFLAGAIHIAASHVHKIITLYVHPTDYRSVAQEYDLSYLGGNAFPLTAFGLAGMVQSWIKAKHKGERLIYFHESGDSGMPRFLEMIRELNRTEPLKAINVVPVPKQDPQSGDWLAPLQFADLIAWEVAREWKELRQGERTIKRRGSLNEVLRHFHVETNLFLRDSLLELVQVFPKLFPKRP